MNSPNVALFESVEATAVQNSEPDVRHAHVPASNTANAVDVVANRIKAYTKKATWSKSGKLISTPARGDKGSRPLEEGANVPTPRSEVKGHRHVNQLSEMKISKG